MIRRRLAGGRALVPRLGRCGRLLLGCLVLACLGAACGRAAGPASARLVPEDAASAEVVEFGPAPAGAAHPVLGAVAVRPGAAVGRLARALDALPVASSPCDPSDAYDEVSFTLASAGGLRVRLVVEIAACGVVSGGSPGALRYFRESAAVSAILRQVLQGGPSSAPAPAAGG